MAGTIIVDRIESDASYASTINVAGQITFSNTVNFGVSSVAPTAGVYLPTTNNLAFTTASTERMRIDSSGNVGIGTASPSTKFHVYTSVAGNTPQTNAGTTALIENVSVTGSAGLKLRSGASAYPNYFTYDVNSGSTATMVFYDQAAGAERMRIDSSGNVGIGTASPAQILDMYRGSGSPWMRLQSGTGAVQGWMQAADSTAVNLGSLSSHPLNLQSAGTTQATISTAGVFSFNSGYGSVATAFGCRAWVNFNGTGTVAIRGSGNVTSITDNGSADYTVNFTTAMPDANYSIGQIAGDHSNAEGYAFASMPLNGTRTTTALRIRTVRLNVGNVDCPIICLSIFR